MILRRVVSSGLLALMVGGLAGCGRSDTGAIDVAMIAPDPHFSGDARPGWVTAATTEPPLWPALSATRAGLVAFDSDGRLTPSLAERWIVTDDALGYIFRLRDAQWADGTPITAADVAVALRHTLDALRGTPLGRDLAPIRTVRAMARRVVEIDLDNAQPDLLTLLAQPELAIAAGPRGQRHAGAMDLKREGDHWLARLIAPDRPGLAPVPYPAAPRALALRFQTAEAAVARFARGDADCVLGGSFATLPLATRLAMARGNLMFDPVVGLFGIDVVSDQGLLGDALNREALAMAIDRDALVAAFGVGGWQPTTRIVTPGLDGDSGAVAERWTDRTPAQRRSDAAARIVHWQAAHPGTPHLTLLLPAGPGSDILFQRLHDDWAAIGITLDRATRVQGADLVLVDQVARYPRARWYLNRLTCAQHRPICTPVGDATLKSAIEAPDANAPELYAEAEGIMTQANGFIPLARPLRWSLTHGSMIGLSANPAGWHPLPPLAAGDTTGN